MTARNKVTAGLYPNMWTVDILAKPRSLNQERAKGRFTRSADTKLWRDTYGCEAVAQLLGMGAEPWDGEFRISSWMDYADNAHHLDLGNWYGSIKAIVDRLVLDGMLVEDNPDYMYGVDFMKGGVDPALTGPRLSINVWLGG